MASRDKTLATMFVEALDKRVEVEGGKTSRRVLILEKIIEKADAGDIKCQKLLLAFMETPAASSPDSLMPTDPEGPRSVCARGGRPPSAPQIRI